MRSKEEIRLLYWSEHYGRELNRMTRSTLKKITALTAKNEERQNLSNAEFPVRLYIVATARATIKLPK